MKYVVSAIVLVSTITGVVSEGDAPHVTTPLGRCDFSNDCDDDVHCGPGLLCADDHKNELGRLGYDERTANCGKDGVKNIYWEVCFDASLLNAPSGGGFGDPHFQTYDGTQYSFHGQCDLVMARSESFENGLGLDVHARTEMIDNWSLISSAAVRIGDDVLEVGNDNTHILNGNTDVELPAIMAGRYTVTKKEEIIESTTDNGEKTELHLSEYSIDLGRGESITISNYKKMLSVRVNAFLSDSEGMLGNQRKVGMVGRDRETVITDPNAMGLEWQVRDNERKMFSNSRAPQFPEQCILPEVKSRRLRQTPQELQRAEEACANVNTSMRQFCVADVLQTGDVAMAGTYSSGFAF